MDKRKDIFSGIERSLKNLRLTKGFVWHWAMTRKKRISPCFSYSFFPTKEIPSSLKFEYRPGGRFIVRRRESILPRICRVMISKNPLFS